MSANIEQIKAMLERAAINCKEQIARENPGGSWDCTDVQNAFKAGAEWQKEQDELPLIIKWFNTIRQMAISRKTGNGAIMTDSDVLDEIAVKAKDAIEYLEQKN